MELFEFKSLQRKFSSFTGREDILANNIAEPSNTQKIISNLLIQIPTEASGFYVLAMSIISGNINDSDGNVYVISAITIAILSLVILFVVRILGKTSKGVLITSFIAFIFWMMMLENGAIKIFFPDNDILNVIISIGALFYTAIVTLLANNGKIK